MKLALAISIPLLSCSLWATTVQPAPLSSLTPQGKERFKVAILKIYDAELYTQPSAILTSSTSPQSLTKPYALKLTYLRTLHGKAIAKRSLKEMKKLGPISETQGAKWLEQMSAIFPNVKKGDVITGVQSLDLSSNFYLNGEFIGRVTDAAFGEYFFGIWLNPNTSAPGMRAALLKL